MCHALGHDENPILFQCAKAFSEDIDLAHFDVVYLAALVRISIQYKRNILERLVKQRKPGALVTH